MPGYNLPSVTLLYINQALLHFACDLSGDARCPHGPRAQSVGEGDRAQWLGQLGYRHLEKDQQSYGK